MSGMVNPSEPDPQSANIPERNASLSAGFFHGDEDRTHGGFQAHAEEVRWSTQTATERHKLRIRQQRRRLCSPSIHANE
jgi:hypothetical protein